MKIAVIGQGYVGLPLALSAWKAGHTVIGYDTDAKKIEMLDGGKSPIEDVTDEDIVRMRLAGADHLIRYMSTRDPNYLSGADVFVVTVPTPLKDGEPNLDAVRSAASTIAPWVHGHLVVLESTVAPGTTEGEFADVIMARAGVTPGTDYMLAFSPERIDPGNRVWNFRTTPKLVAGFDRESLAAAYGFYSSICDTVVPVNNLKEAEMAKLLENTFRHVNIALVNEMARHAQLMGIDFSSVTAAASTKPYGFMKFTHGPGVGGHCLPIDPVYLSRKIESELGTSSSFIDLAVEINNAQPAYVVHRAMLNLNERAKPVKGSKVLILGYSYKPNTADNRETPAEHIVSGLVDLGASVWICDPLKDAPLTLGHKGNVSIETALDEPYNLIIVVTDHEVFKPYYAVFADNGYSILDTRNVVEGKFVDKL